MSDHRTCWQKLADEEARADRYEAALREIAHVEFCTDGDPYMSWCGGCIARRALEAGDE
jgi:hypothetical protein